MKAQFAMGVLFPILYYPVAALLVSAASRVSSLLLIPSAIVAIGGFIAIALCYRVKLGWKAFIPGALAFILLAPLILFGAMAVICGAIRL